MIYAKLIFSQSIQLGQTVASFCLSLSESHAQAQCCCIRVSNSRVANTKMYTRFHEKHVYILGFVKTYL